ncbi:MAG: tetratricopeptide repeat protein [Candidatus Diapherotrites archaeon]|nr:tetratricopeptide repeat protein [Candidatus Diapherotrites archaeon]
MLKIFWLKMDEREFKKEMKKSFQEYELAWNEFFKNRPRPKNDNEEQKEGAEFVFWYNNVRPQSDTGKTPAEMGERNIEYDETTEEDEEAMEKQFAMDDILGWMHDGEYDKALNECEYILKNEPKNVEALLLKFEALTGLNEMAQAMKILGKCKLLEPENPYISFHLAAMLILKQDFKGAINEINKALEKDEKNFDFLVLKAQALYMTNEQTYTEYLKQAEKVDRKRALNFFDNYWYDTYPESETEILKSMEKVTELLFNNENAKALEELVRLENFPLRKEYRNLIASAKIKKLLEENNLQQAQSVLGLMLDEAALSPITYCSKASLEFAEGNSKGALETLEQAIGEYPKTALGYLGLYTKKVEILKALGDDSYKKIEENVEKMQKQSLEDISKTAKEIGKTLVTKNGLIKFE